MPVSIVTTAAVVASSSAVTSNSIALAAKKNACAAYINSYNATGAPVDEMQRYANCVNLLHPVTSSVHNVWLVKAWIVCMLVGVIIGAWYAWRDASRDIFFYMAFPAMGGMLGGILPFIAFILFKGVVFLFS